ncbi:Sodium/pyruvate cotransporter BASS2, chloroplastic [Seminavis robusta]|uniref:Sodium/pyruvate cotransporter BASS2, chloroplastic n=1 Tax=Seminavis robusta TaxID=568900 RepID=A0A9N8ECD6_9STRA|nr:Sodium/pyruvate cotransporter BASS2, chloroplastic [Seminavis robusta]|eukprot:Sro917_g219950.1 Sodium/pyruvate cotransporter BASS2, chloroplastic (423) ;mRNA; r:33053-34414
MKVYFYLSTVASLTVLSGFHVIPVTAFVVPSSSFSQQALTNANAISNAQTALSLKSLKKLTISSSPVLRQSFRKQNLKTTALWESTTSSLDQDLPVPQEQPSAQMVKFRKYAQAFCNLFPIWTLLTAGTALARPSTFLSIPASTFPAQIGMLMLCMGISLKPSDFKRVAQRPAAVLLAFLGCYGVMPGLAFAIGKIMGLSPPLAAGLVLVSCINGAQASNLCTYIGQGDLALSVLMTTMTTIGAIVMTPLMGKLLLGTVVPVNAQAIALSTIQVVLAPILVGMTFNAKFPNVVQKILPFSPILGVLITCLLVGVSVAGCAGPIMSAGFQLQASAALLHTLGGVAGYFLTKPFYGEDVCRTFAIEFAMKSSAFGYLLATQHFSEFAVRVPAAVSIVWMTLIGSSMAVASRFFPPEECVVPDEE